jgi:hypothetical protein
MRGPAGCRPCGKKGQSDANEELVGWSTSPCPVGRFASARVSISVSGQQPKRKASTSTKVPPAAPGYGGSRWQRGIRPPRTPVARSGLHWGVPRLPAAAAPYQWLREQGREHVESRSICAVAVPLSSSADPTFRPT